MHTEWVDKQLSKLGEVASINLKLLLNQYDNLCDAIFEYDEKIEG